MNGKAFFDTNILVYAYGPFDAGKSITARELIWQEAKSENGLISYQVVQEFLNLALRKFNVPVTTQAATEFLDELVAGLDVIPWSLALMEAGLAIASKYKFSWYDSLIVAAALAAGCETLYTEDLQHGQNIDGLIVVNPFLP